MTKSIVNKRYKTKIRVLEDFPTPQMITIGKNKRQIKDRLEPYHTNNPGKLISVPWLFWKKIFLATKKKFRKIFKKK